MSKLVEIDENVQEARALIHQAVGRINEGDSEAAVWRLVDAVGLLSEFFPYSIGVDCPTGRGYQIVRR